jgi:hypothetical protein
LEGIVLDLPSNGEEPVASLSLLFRPTNDLEPVELVVMGKLNVLL